MSARGQWLLGEGRLRPAALTLAFALTAAVAGAAPSDGPAVCTWLPPLRYPSLLAERGPRLGGDILVRVTLDAQGKLARAELMDSDLPDLFVAEALRAAHAGRYEPARRAGRRQASSLILLLRFPGRPPAPSAARSDSASQARPLAPAAGAALPAALPPDLPPNPPLEAPAPESTPSSAASTLRVLDAGFGSGIENRRLTGRRQIFAPGSKVYFWMEVDGARPGQVLRHIWIYQGRELQEIALTLKGERWPTWSYKTFFPEQRGAWLLELRDENDDLLGSWFCYCE